MTFKDSPLRKWETVISQIIKTKRSNRESYWEYLQEVKATSRFRGSIAGGCVKKMICSNSGTTVTTKEEPWTWNQRIRMMETLSSVKMEQLHSFQPCPLQIKVLQTWYNQQAQSKRWEEEKKRQLWTLKATKMLFKKGGETKTFLDEGKLRKFVVSKPTLNEWLKEALQQKGEGNRRRLGTSGRKEHFQNR